MTDRHDLLRLQSVGLSPYDINVLSTMVKTGGEISFYIDRCAPEARQLHVTCMNSLAERDLIAVDEARSTVSRWILKLTDKGRAVAAKLEEMNAKPRVEVQMNGAMPEVVSK